MHPLLTIALRAARDAAETIAHQSDRVDRVKIIESSPGNIITSAEQDAEATIIYHIQQAHPEHSISSRLSGDKPGEDSSIVWLIDPLAGTENFMRGVPRFAVSVACQVNNKIRHAVLIDPLLNEEYTASRGGGANLNGRRLRVTDRKTLEDGLTSLDYPATEDGITHLLSYQRCLVEAGSGIYISGCGVLDIAHTAAGRFDCGSGIYPGKSSIAAAALMLQESGGLISDITGNPEINNAEAVVFGNPKCFKQLLQLEKRLTR
ncbi:MAG: inositol monophosphatase [Gammaproteobacteria bacterium]|nr:inositol monophosphatase [Gammaproteobacteria bacterium]